MMNARRPLGWCIAAAGALLTTVVVPASAASASGHVVAGRHPAVRSAPIFAGGDFAGYVADDGFSAPDAVSASTSGGYAFSTDFVVPQVLCNDPTESGPANEITVSVEAVDVDSQGLTAGVDEWCNRTTPVYTISGRYPGGSFQDIGTNAGDRIDIRTNEISGKSVYRITDVTTGVSHAFKGPLQYIGWTYTVMQFYTDNFPAFTPLTVLGMTYNHQPMAAAPDVEGYYGVDPYTDLLLANVSAVGSDGKSFTVTDALHTPAATDS